MLHSSQPIFGSYICSTVGSKQPTQLKVDYLFLKVRLRTHDFTCGSSLHSSVSSICFFSVWCCSFTQVAHGGSEQQPNLQPYTTRNIVALLTEYFKKKRKERCFLPALKDGVSTPKILMNCNKSNENCKTLNLFIVS